MNVDMLGISELKWTGMGELRALVAQRIKHLPAMQETRVRSLGWEDSPGNGQRSLAGYSPRGRKESDKTE